MKITAEILERFGLQEEDINSIEFSEAIAKDQFPQDLFHYIRAYYRLSEEEFELYCNYCKIMNSENFWDSSRINNCKNVIHSYDITDSSFIRDSENVINSNDIYNSVVVNSSKNVAHSAYVKNSNSIIESQEIKDSDNVARSNNIDWSFVILNSNHLGNCSYTYMSDNLIDCHFCGFTHNSRHCLFCVGLENKEYYIFNQPVSQLEYEQTKEKLEAMLEDEKSTMIKINESKHTSEERFKLDRRFDSIFKGLSSSFYGWIGTLPNYSDDAFLDLFFRDREEVLKINEILN